MKGKIVAAHRDIKGELYDLQGSLVASAGISIQLKSAFGKWYWCKHYKFLATDSEKSAKFYVSTGRPRYVNVSLLKPITEKELPLYINKKYKSKEFLDMF